MSLKSDFQCAHCRKILKEPVTLPCGHTICDEHLDKSIDHEMKIVECVLCKREFNVNRYQFQPNEIVQQLLDKEIHLNDREKHLKKSLEQSIIEFYECYEEFCRNDLSVLCRKHFNAIFFQISERKEKLKTKIDDIASAMTEQTRAFEAFYLKILSKNIESNNEFKRGINGVEGELKELKELYRYPNLVIEEIEKLETFQQEKIADIKLKLSDMRQIKEHLFLSHFEPDLHEKISFGTLNLNELRIDDYFQSKILTIQQSIDLIELGGFNSDQKFSLLYRGSDHGFGAKSFHSKCDGYSPTLTLIRVDDCVFGGFTTKEWDSTSGMKCDQDAFLFSLVNKQNLPVKMNINPLRTNFAIYCNFDYVIFIFNILVLYIDLFINLMVF